jgi:hypothetical protein
MSNNVANQGKVFSIVLASVVGSCAFYPVLTKNMFPCKFHSSLFAMGLTFLNHQLLEEVFDAVFIANLPFDSSFGIVTSNLFL